MCRMIVLFCMFRSVFHHNQTQEIEIQLEVLILNNLCEELTWILDYYNPELHRSGSKKTTIPPSSFNFPFPQVISLIPSRVPEPSGPLVMRCPGHLQTFLQTWVAILQAWHPSWWWWSSSSSWSSSWSRWVCMYDDLYIGHAPKLLHWYTEIVVSNV